MIKPLDRQRLLILIEHLESTSDDQWMCDRVRSKDRFRNCVMGHVFNLGGEDQKLSNNWWDWFECHVATTYMIYPVNDGKHPDYQQPTPKSRILAYLDDVLQGRVLTTYELY